MSLQWALVATFLYVEIAVIILLLLPIIPPRTWQKFFKSRFLKSLENQANLYFTGFLIILVLLFVDSIREMRRYSSGREAEIEHGGHLDAELQFSMKLFRAQRNFYIAGFALFLCLVIRRLVLLIQSQAELIAQKEAALKQAKGASDAAQSLMKGTNSGDVANAANEQQLKKVEKQLQETKDELNRVKTDGETLKKQAKSVTTEYDRLMKEHSKLQELYDKVTSESTRKDR